MGGPSLQDADEGNGGRRAGDVSHWCGGSHNSHIGTHCFRRKCDASRSLDEYPRVAVSRRVFGPYRLLAKLSDSDVGETLLAKRIGPEGFEKRVVIRRVRCDGGSRDDRVAAMALEANAAALLSHANVAHLLDLGARGPWCFVVTEHVDGCTLADLLRSRRPLPWMLCSYIANEAAKGLSYAHRRRHPTGDLLRLVHCRISPRCIALSAAGDVKVTGFGTSWAWAEREPYRSPEAKRSEPVDGRADVFALGVTLRKSMSGQDAPPLVRRAVEQATHDLPEHRMTAAQLHEALSEALHASAQRIGSRDVAALVDRLAAHDATLRSA